MAATYDAASSASAGATTSLSWSHTCTGSNRVLTVGVAATFGSNPTFSVTYNGVAMTSVGSRRIAGGWMQIQLFRLVAPATGANTVAVSSTATVDMAAGAVSAYDADQTTPVGTFASAEGNTTPATVDVSGATGDLVVDVCCYDQNTAPTAGAGQTERWTRNWGANGSGSTETGAATTTMSWSGNNADWAIGGVAIKAASGALAAAPQPRRALLGVGA